MKPHELAAFGCVVGTLALGALALGTLVPGVSAQEAEVDWDLLEEQRVLVEFIDNAEGTPGIRIYSKANASRERVWTSLTDYDRFLEIFEGIDDMELLDCDAGGASVEFWIGLPLWLEELNFVLYREYAEPGTRMTWSTVEVKSGLAEDLNGSWEIRDAPDDHSKLLIYESYVDIGPRVVNLAARLAVRSRARQLAEKFVIWVEQSTESRSGSCPSPGP